MNFINKNEKANHYDNSCNQLIDIFSSIFHKRVSGKLEISVGNNVSNGFMSILTSVTDCFSIVPTQYKNEQQLIFKNLRNRAHEVMTLVNLSKMSDVHIKKEDLPNCMQFDVSFRYMNKIDYSIRVTVRDAIAM